jgi:hypothetical protein
MFNHPYPDFDIVGKVAIPETNAKHLFQKVVERLRIW